MDKSLNRMHLLIENYDKNFQSDLLMEAMSTDEIHQKYYAKIPKEDFNQIVSADPTTTPQKMGLYAKWMLSLYLAKRLKIEDLYKATEYLTTFHKYKNKISQKDISKYPDLPSLYNVVQPFEVEPDQSTSNADEIRKAKEGAIKVYEDERWLIIAPNTEQSACYYGKGTQWCTASTSAENMFDHYNKRGKLYINIDKKNNRKYQFHFQSGQYMDERDNELPQPIADVIGMDREVLRYYEQNESNYGDLYDNKSSYRLNSKIVAYHFGGLWGIMDNNGNKITEPLFTEEQEKYGRYFVIQKSTSADNYLNWSGLLDNNGNLLLPLMYRMVDVNNGSNMAVVQNQERKYGLVNMLNQIVIPIEYDLGRFNHYNMLVFKKGNFWLCADQDGKIVIDINQHYTDDAEISRDALDKHYKDNEAQR